MTSLFGFLAKNMPTFETRKALVLIGLQNDILAPGGRLQAELTKDYVDHVKALITNFRPHGDLIWVRSEFDPTINSQLKEIDDHNTVIQTEGEHNGGQLDNEELFLNPNSRHPQICLKGTPGADFLPALGNLIQPQDIQMIKNQYSAFTSTSLLSTLRSRLVTRLYICGSLTNISVYATALDAARSGIEAVLVEDCLAYRSRARHELALKHLLRYSVAKCLASERALHLLQHPEDDVASEAEDDDDQSGKWFEEGGATAKQSELEVDTEDDVDNMPLPSVLPLRTMERPSEVDNADMARARRSPRSREHTADSRQSKPSRTKMTTCSAEWGSKNTQDKPAVVQSPSSASNFQLRRRDDSQATAVSRRTEPEIITQAHSNSTTKSTTNARRSINGALKHHQQTPLFGEEKSLESAGSRIVHDLLPPDLADVAFERIQAEIQWQRMLHLTGEVPRLVCCQGTIAEDGSFPIYRHPSDRTIAVQPWSKTVDEIRQIAQDVLGHELNHALVQLYRNGNDFISEHSDKTLDVVPGSIIVNVSLGAERTMRLRSKRAAANPSASRTTHRVRMAHNSMLSMTLDTNASFLHGINADKRPGVELSDAETAFDGQRISVTFRRIGTFLTADSELIWGQGAVGRTRQDARRALTGAVEENERLIKAFGTENQSSSMDWKAWYGQGSDVLHLK